jgi:hypothetical protein
MCQPVKGALVPKYLIIREGLTAAKSHPIFVSADPELIEALGQLISERLIAEPDQPARRPLSAVPKRTTTDEDGA